MIKSIGADRIVNHVFVLLYQTSHGSIIVMDCTNISTLRVDNGDAENDLSHGIIKLLRI